MNRSQKPWEKPDWETTRNWQNLIQQLKYDLELHDPSSPKHKELLEKFFRTTLEWKQRPWR